MSALTNNRLQAGEVNAADDTQLLLSCPQFINVNMS